MASEDYYDDGGGEQTSPMGEESPKSSNTALLPSELCPGMKPGDTVTLTIKRVLDGQYEVSYNSGESEESTAEEPPPEDPEMAEMMA